MCYSPNLVTSRESAPVDCHSKFATYSEKIDELFLPTHLGRTSLQAAFQRNRQIEDWRAREGSINFQVSPQCVRGCEDDHCASSLSLSSFANHRTCKTSYSRGGVVESRCMKVESMKSVPFGRISDNSSVFVQQGCHEGEGMMQVM